MSFDLLPQSQQSVFITRDGMPIANDVDGAFRQDIQSRRAVFTR